MTAAAAADEKCSFEDDAVVEVLLFNMIEDAGSVMVDVLCSPYMRYAIMKHTRR